MLNKKMDSALNDQVQAELYSAYLYFSMAANFHAENLNGFAHWMIMQAKEEMEHVRKFYDYLYQRGSRLTLEAVKKPPAKWNSPLAAFEDALKHEMTITKRIDDLVALAQQEKDNGTLAFLQWFVTEQVEEEASVEQVIQKLKMVKDAPAGLMFLDRELGSR